MAIMAVNGYELKLSNLGTKTVKEFLKEIFPVSGLISDFVKESKKEGHKSDIVLLSYERADSSTLNLIIGTSFNIPHIYIEKISSKGEIQRKTIQNLYLYLYSSTSSTDVLTVFNKYIREDYK